MLTLIGLALAEFPLPTYPECGEPDRPDLCPSDMEGKWNFLSYIPAAWGVALDATEEEGMGSGMWLDRAFRVTTGRTDVVIAVIDSGVHWDDTDVVRKFVLNANELPPPEGSDVHDKNGDGALTVADYEGDTRVEITAGDDAADHLLDPSDLIATFSDGVDDDGNAYIDDICGWDFQWDDNNPYDDVRFGHGTGESEDAAAEGNDGGDIGTCPNCVVLPVRVGDSFVVDGSTFGSGLVFAVDSGADVALVAAGAVQQTATVEAAIEYAWDMGALTIGSAADETAYHPNPPGMAAHTFYVHAIVYNGDDPEDSTSFLAYSNCTNHGVRLDGSASSTSCSSGATGVTSGITGLVISAARDAGWEPTPGELHALLARGADDIALPDDPSRYPTKTGWDAWSGWGRVNAYNAVLAASLGEVPPVAELSEPGWYDWIDPMATPVVTVAGLATSRGEVASWSLSYGLGLEPTEWTEVDSGQGALDGPIADFTLPDFDVAIIDPPKGTNPVDRELNANAATVQLRLVVTDDKGRTTTARTSFYVHHDPDAVAGWPVELPHSLESSPALADLDGDGAAEVIQADSGGWVHALRADGSELDGWPVHTEPLPELDPDNAAHHRASAGWTALGADVYAPVTATPAVADLDGDGTMEVVVATFRGRVHVFGTDGAEWAGFPVASEPVTYTDEDDSLADSFFSSPALGDIDGDGAYEIVLGAGDQQVYAWEIDGSYTAGFPVRLAWPDEVLDRRRIVASPAIGDIDGDGRDDIVIGTNETVTEEHAALYAVDGTGQVMPGWPIRLYGLFVDVLPMVGQGVPNSAALVDLDGDGVPEVVTHGLAGDVEVVHGDGTDFFKTTSALSAYGPGSNVSDTTIFPLINSPSIGDLDGDGVADIVNGAAGFDYARGTDDDGMRYDFDHALGGWSGVDGNFLPGFPRMVEDLQFFANPAVVDIDGDRRMEAITGSGGFIVHAWNADGEQPSGWPKLTGQWVIASPAVGDIDGDGTLEVVVGTREGYLFAWHTGTDVGADAGWVRFGHDNRNTHNYEVPLDGWNTWPDADTEPDLSDERGCGCVSLAQSAPGLGRMASILIGLATLLAATRRRKDR